MQATTFHEYGAQTRANAGHDISELEPLLEAIMLEDFNAEMQDGSCGQVRSIRHCQLLRALRDTVNCH